MYEAWMSGRRAASLKFTQDVASLLGPRECRRWRTQQASSIKTLMLIDTRKGFEMRAMCFQAVEVEDMDYIFHKLLTFSQTSWEDLFSFLLARSCQAAVDLSTPSQSN